MIFDTTYAKRDPFLLNQLQEANKYLPFINEAANKYNLQPCIIAGLGSRESAWGLTLKPKGPEGTGDFAERKPKSPIRPGPLPPDGLGFGRGLLQIDYDWHEFARTGNWMDQKENILFGCSILVDSLKICNRRLKLDTGEFVFPWCADDRALLRAAISGYNAGASRVISCISARGDVDEITSGGNYSADILDRAGWFQLQGWTDEVIIADLLKDKQSSFNKSMSC